MNGLIGKSKPLFKLLIFIVMFFLTAAPVVYLLTGSVLSIMNGTISFDHPINLPLFLNSVMLNLGAAVSSVIFGLFSAVGIWMFYEKKALKIIAGVLLMLLLPPFLHIQSWIFLMDKLTAGFNSVFNTSFNFTGAFAVILTISFSYLPITAGMSLIALISVPQELSDLCLLDCNGIAAFRKVYLPYLVPSFCVGGFLVFLLNMNDYGIPSLFGVNVYALELFARFSAGNNIYEVFAASAPLLIISILIILIFGISVSKNNIPFHPVQGRNPFKQERFLKIAAMIGSVIGFLFVFVPISNLLYEAFRSLNAVEILITSMDEIIYSFGISALSAIVCLFPSLLFAYFFYQSKHSGILLCAAALPFIIPSAIAGLSLIEMWNTPLLATFYHSPFMPVIAMLAKFTFIEALILSVALSRLDKALLDNLKLDYPGLMKFAWCIFRLIQKECLSGILIVFALAMGEFGMTLLVTPPGYQTVTMKIYNYLHYGSSETIAVLCLFMLVVVLTTAFFLYSLLTGDAHEQ